MSFIKSLDIGGSALSAQRTRMDVISQNIANADNYHNEDGEPYVRQLTVFNEKKEFSRVLGEKTGRYKYAGVEIAEVIDDETPSTPVYDPDNPYADENGYIYMPNVDMTKEILDIMAASRSYEANVTAVNAVKAMLTKASEIGK